MKLDLTSLEKAVERMKQCLDYYELDLAKNDEGRRLLSRTAAIQTYEYTYELCHKILKRYLEMTEPTPSIIDIMSFSELIRTGSEKDLLRSDWRRWKEYRDIRNITAHTYDDEKAEKAFAIIPDFLKEAEFLLNKLKGKNIDV